MPLIGLDVRGDNFPPRIRLAAFQRGMGLADGKVSQLDPRPREIGHVATNCSVTEFLGIWTRSFVREINLFHLNTLAYTG